MRRAAPTTSCCAPAWRCASCRASSTWSGSAGSAVPPHRSRRSLRRWSSPTSGPAHRAARRAPRRPKANVAAQAARNAAGTPAGARLALAAFLLGRLRAGWNESGMEPARAGRRRCGRGQAVEDRLYLRLQGIQRATLLRADALPAHDAAALGARCAIRSRWGRCPARDGALLTDRGRAGRPNRRFDPRRRALPAVRKPQRRAICRGLHCASSRWPQPRSGS